MVDVDTYRQHCFIALSCGINVQECELRQEQWVARTAATQEAYQTCLSEGQQLIALLRQQTQKENFDNAESIVVVEQVKYCVTSCASTL